MFFELFVPENGLPILKHLSRCNAFLLNHTFKIHKQNNFDVVPKLAANICPSTNYDLDFNLLIIDRP